MRRGRTRAIGVGLALLLAAVDGAAAALLRAPAGQSAEPGQQAVPAASAAPVRLAGGIRPGDVVVANLADHSVSVFDGESGAYRGAAFAPGAGGLRNATGIAYGPDGHLYVGSAGTGQVLRYDGTTGAFLGVFAEGDPLTQPFSLMFGPEGDLFVSSGASVLRYAPDGSFRRHAARDSSLKQPIGLAYGPDGRLYVVNPAARVVQRYDPETGHLVDAFATDSLSFPSDVAIGPDGDVYVSSAATSRVVRFDGATGAFEEVAAVLPAGGVPMGLAFRDRRLVVGDFGGGRLFFLDPDAPELRLVASEGLRQPENVAIRPRGPHERRRQ